MAKRNRNRNAAPVATPPMTPEPTPEQIEAIHDKVAQALDSISEPTTEPEPVATSKFSPCECGCGLPARRRFVVGHDARKHAADALAARAKRSHSTIEEQIARDLENRKQATRAKGKAKRAAEKAEYAAALASAKAVKAETPEQTAEALATEGPSDADIEADDAAIEALESADGSEGELALSISDR